MIISTRGRYALRVMIDLAESGQSGYIPMKTIAGRQGVSLKYMERILPVLAKNKLIEGVHGKGGGYRLCRRPEEYRVGEILRLTEGGLDAVGSVLPGNTVGETGDPKEESCCRAESCRTVAMWKGLQEMIDEYFDGILLSDLCGNSCRCPAKEERCRA